MVISEVLMNEAIKQKSFKNANEKQTKLLIKQQKKTLSF